MDFFYSYYLNLYLSPRCSIKASGGGHNVRKLGAALTFVKAYTVSGTTYKRDLMRKPKLTCPASFVKRDRKLQANLK